MTMKTSQIEMSGKVCAAMKEALSVKIIKVYHFYACTLSVSLFLSLFVYIQTYKIVKIFVSIPTDNALFQSVSSH